MVRVYPDTIVSRIRSLRSSGLTYREINAGLGVSMPKGTLSYLCKGVGLGNGHEERMIAEAHERMMFVRELAVKKKSGNT